MKLFRILRKRAADTIEEPNPQTLEAEQKVEKDVEVSLDEVAAIADKVLEKIHSVIVEELGKVVEDKINEKLDEIKQTLQQQQEVEEEKPELDFEIPVETPGTMTPPPPAPQPSTPENTPAEEGGLAQTKKSSSIIDDETLEDLRKKALVDYALRRRKAERFLHEDANEPLTRESRLVDSRDLFSDDSIKNTTDYVNLNNLFDDIGKEK